jgi:hypothetical protein
MGCGSDLGCLFLFFAIVASSPRFALDEGASGRRRARSASSARQTPRYQIGGAMLRIDVDEIPALSNAEISATCSGLSVSGKGGQPAKLAIVDEAANVFESGDHVGRAACMLMLLARRNFLEGQGHVRVLRPERAFDATGAARLPAPPLTPL